MGQFDELLAASIFTLATLLEFVPILVALAAAKKAAKEPNSAIKLLIAALVIIGVQLAGYNIVLPVPFFVRSSGVIPVTIAWTLYKVVLVCGLVGLGVGVGFLRQGLSWFAKPENREMIGGKVSAKLDAISSAAETIRGHDLVLPEGMRADLTDDAYKLWLVNNVGVSKNEIFEQYVCDQRLFDTLDEALDHAHTLVQTKQKDN